MSGNKTKDSFANSLGLSYTSLEKLVLDFTNRGLVILSPESLGLPLDTHHLIYQKQKQAIREGKKIRPSTIPQILEIINAQGLVKICNRLVGENWAIVPFPSSSITSGGSDQHWHKDDNAPRNSRKQRHHQIVQIEMLHSTSGTRRYGSYSHHSLFALLDFQS